MDAEMASVPQGERVCVSAKGTVREGVCTRSKRILESGLRDESVCGQNGATNDVEGVRQEIKKKRYNNEPVFYSAEHKGNNKKNGGSKRDNVDDVDKDVNKILTPFTYSSVAKKPKKAYVHRPGVQMHKRMFEEVSPSSPVIMKGEHRVSELEKITVELLKFT
ncbi:uncharacterized protein [Musca autumnalis]|uniref:uncharacterized protein n=1 Tax=Musca autumnalis TaxID=221902 RepID=UPI003CF5B032